ncbi:MAG: aspartate 1-decarboxylase [Candidatus Electrothrix sp. YB6]
MKAGFRGHRPERGGRPQGACGDLIIIVSYAQYEESELEGFAPKIILCDEKNGIRKLIDK